MLLKCADCPAFFIVRNKRSYRCRPCQQKATAQGKLDSQRDRYARKRQTDPFDISAEEIESRFTAALKEIRRQPSAGMEPFRSYGWLYREPRS